MDLIISAVEINDRHGVGVYLRRIFQGRTGLVSLRSCTMYGGVTEFGEEAWALHSRGMGREEALGRLARWLGDRLISRILCVPYFVEDFWHAIWMKDLTGAPLSLYLMDDQNVFHNQVGDEVVAELWDLADLRLGISPELCAAYERKYGGEIHLLPPVMTEARRPVPNYWNEEPGEPLVCAMIGNVWSAEAFNRLRCLIREAGIRVEWYGNGSRAPWLPGSMREWAQDGILCLGHLPEEDLAVALAGYLCILIPSGEMDGQDDKLSFSRLSLPSRVISTACLAVTPQLVLGHPETAAARFVRRQGIGESARYSPKDFRGAMQRACRREVRDGFCRNIEKTAKALAFPGVGDWIWEGLRKGRPGPAPFQDLPGFGQITELPWLKEIHPIKKRSARKKTASHCGVGD